MKVLAIVPSGFCFGLQNLTLSFFAALSKRVRVHFLNTRWNDGEFPRRLRELGIAQSFTWLGMFSRKLDRRNLQMTISCLFKLPLAWLDFVKLYREFRPDVIYFANHHELLLLWPLLMVVHKKVVCHMHDPPPAIAFQRLSFFFWRRAVDRFIFVSQNVRDRTAVLGRLKAVDVVLHNGVQVEELLLPRVRSERFVQKFRWPGESLIVGITGQMMERKGHEDFLEAARLSLIHERQLRFIIGGKPVDPYFTELQEWVHKYALDSYVAFSGWSPEARDFYEGIDVFVLASRHDEGFGLVIAEAMERGCVVIATRSGGASEIIEDGISGYLVSKHAPDQIAEKIVSVARHSALKHQISEAARLRINTRFKQETQVSAFEELLHRMRMPNEIYSRQLGRA